MPIPHTWFREVPRDSGQVNNLNATVTVVIWRNNGKKSDNQTFGSCTASINSSISKSINTSSQGTFVVGLKGNQTLMHVQNIWVSVKNSSLISTSTHLSSVLVLIVTFFLCYSLFIVRFKYLYLTFQIREKWAMGHTQKKNPIRLCCKWWAVAGFTVGVNSFKLHSIVTFWCK